MHIRRLRIRNIRSIRNLQVEIPEPRAGWHVILGDNGSGKSSVIRALALALMGPVDAAATRQDWQDWIRKTAPTARVDLEVAPEAEFDKWKRTGRRAKAPISVTVVFQAPSPTAKRGATLPLIAGRYADRTIWGGGAGWFSASFGPFRRFSGGDKEYDRLFLHQSWPSAPPVRVRRGRSPWRSIEMAARTPVQAVRKGCYRDPLAGPLGGLLEAVTVAASRSTHQGNHLSCCCVQRRCWRTSTRGTT